MRTVFDALSIFLAALVLLLSIAGVAGVWVLEQKASNVAVEVLARTEKAAQSARNGIEYVNTRVAGAREAVNSIEEAAAQISQIVADKGLVATLLPEQKTQQVEAELQELVDIFAGFREGLLATINLINAIDRIPGVNLPEPDPERVQKAGETIDTIQSRAGELEQEIRDFRAGAAEKISQVQEIASRIDSRLAEVQTDLGQLDAQLAALQASANRLQQTLPTTFIIIASVSTVLLLWVAYTQVVVLQLAWGKLRSPRG